MGRKTKELPIKDTFLILTNGRRTEKSYFEIVRSVYNSLYKIDVKYLNKDPEGLVFHAVRIREKYSRIWCVFDKDNFTSESIYRSLNVARDNHIDVAFSNISFEVWLINHFEKIQSEKSQKQLIELLEDKLVENGYSNEYLKSDSDVIEKLVRERMWDACDNADVVYQKRMADYKLHSDGERIFMPICSWNPYTNVHKLIESLRIQKI